MLNTEQIEKAKKIGSEWQKGQMHRIYFNNLCLLYGLRCEAYKTGNIASAELNGERISNSEARRIQDRFSWSKVWYDMNDGRLYCKDVNDEDFNIICNSIRQYVGKAA